MKHKILILFSGGCDSTLAAAIASEKFPEVYLVTYKRLGVFRTSRPMGMVERLKKKYPSTQFHYELIDIDEYFKKICYENYLSGVLKHGIKLLSACGMCKVAMHWRTIEYCLDNDIKEIFDGAVRKSETFPAQNKKIMLNKLDELYSFFGLTYSTPVYDNWGSVELELYNRGITSARKIKQTERDKFQPMCIDNLLFSRFVDYYLGTHTWEEYEKDLAELYTEKLDYVKTHIKKNN